jgi:hypothetical protein
LQQIEAELARIGLLLEHDRLLPSVTTLVAGQPIAGSWWGHALGHRIYDLLGQLERGRRALCARSWKTQAHLRASAAARGILRADRTASSRGRDGAAASWPRGFSRSCAGAGAAQVGAAAVLALAPSKQLVAAARELEERCSLHGDSEHTASGKHEKTLETWSSWRTRHAVVVEVVEPSQARAALDEAVSRLERGRDQAAERRYAAGVKRLPLAERAAPPASALRARAFGLLPDELGALGVLSAQASFARPAAAVAVARGAPVVASARSRRAGGRGPFGPDCDVHGSADGSHKLLLDLGDARIEAVHMPRAVASERVTLCISSQAAAPWAARSARRPAWDFIAS